MEKKKLTGKSILEKHNIKIDYEKCSQYIEKEKELRTALKITLDEMIFLSAIEHATAKKMHGKKYLDFCIDNEELAKQRGL